MSLHLAITALERHAIEEHDCPECDAPAGRACMRSGGAIVGGSTQRFGEYVHGARIQAARDARA